MLLNEFCFTERAHTVAMSRDGLITYCGEITTKRSSMNYKKIEARRSTCKSELVWTELRRRRARPRSGKRLHWSVWKKGVKLLRFASLVPLTESSPSTQKQEETTVTFTTRSETGSWDLHPNCFRTKGTLCLQVTSQTISDNVKIKGRINPEGVYPQFS